MSSRFEKLSKTQVGAKIEGQNDMAHSDDKDNSTNRLYTEPNSNEFTFDKMSVDQTNVNKTRGLQLRLGISCSVLVTKYQPLIFSQSLSFVQCPILTYVLSN